MEFILSGEDGIFWMILAAILLLIPSQRRAGLGMWLAGKIVKTRKEGKYEA